jgi:hypothetical protein
MTTVPELLAELSRVADAARLEAIAANDLAARLSLEDPQSHAYACALEELRRANHLTDATAGALALAHDTATELDRRTLEPRRTLADAEHARRLARLAFADAVAEVHDARANCDAVADEDGGHQAEAAHRLELAGQDLAEARDELARTDAEWMTAYRQEQTR